MSQLLNALDVARRLGLMDHAAPSEAVRWLRRTGQLQGVRVGRRWRYQEAEIEAFIRKAVRKSGN